MPSWDSFKLVIRSDEGQLSFYTYKMSIDSASMTEFHQFATIFETGDVRRMESCQID